MSDEFIFSQSQDVSGVSVSPFTKKTWYMVVDQNNSSYSGGQIQIDTSSLSNNGQFVSMSEGVLQIPLVISLSTSSAIDLTAHENAFLVGLKNNFIHIIDSVSLELQNSSVAQLCPYTNFYVNYKMMTTLSEDDVRKNGVTMGFNPDSSTAFNYTAYTATSVEGQGSQNNRNFGAIGGVVGLTTTTTATNIMNRTGAAINAGALPSANVADGTRFTDLTAETTVTVTPTNAPSTGSIRQVANYGYYQRQVDTAFDPTKTPFSTIYGGAANALTATRKVARNYCDRTANGNATAGRIFWFVLAQIHLKNLHDHFAKMPLAKGLFYRFLINVNTCQHVINVTRAGGNQTQYGISQTILSGRSSPLLWSSCATGQGGQPWMNAITTAGNGSYDFTLRCSVAKDTTLNVAHPISNCRLYVPAYKMSATMQDQYLSLNKTRKVVYEDIIQYTVSVGAGSSFNSLLTNGCPRIRAVVVMPYLAASANQVYNGVTLAPWQSIFASEPSTTSPLISLSNYNVIISGVNMYQSNIEFDYEMFRNEAASINALNGNQTSGLTSGLISEQDFQFMYRYYVTDVSRRLPQDDPIPRSVNIIGTNNTNLDIQLICFIVYERDITIDVETGMRIE